MGQSEIAGVGKSESVSVVGLGLGIGIGIGIRSRSPVDDHHLETTFSTGARHDPAAEMDRNARGAGGAV